MKRSITIRSGKPQAKIMSQKEVFKRIESQKVGGRKKMIWFDQDQANLMQVLRIFEPSLSDSKIIRRAMNLYMKMYQAKRNKKRSA